MVAEGSTAILWTVYFLAISPNCIPFLWFATGLNFITAILCFQATESPRYLYCSQQYDRCSDALCHIAKFNGIKDYEKPEFEV